MKKIKINISALQTTCEVPLADPVSGEFIAFKVSVRKALTFNEDDETLCYQGLCKKFGEENRLKIGEFYNGYLVVKSPFRNQIIYMCGYLEKAQSCSSVAPDHIQLAFEKGWLYNVWIKLSPNNPKCTGHFRKVWLFNTTPFEKSGPVHIAMALKVKLSEAASRNKCVELSDSEDDVLSSYLGPLYYESFFTEV